MKILVVDDNKNSCDDLYNFLIKNYKADKSYSGLDALKKIKENKFGLLISDVDMPVLNGIELVKIIKQLGINIKIILISGKNEIIESINAFELGIYDFLNKPLDLFALDDLIEKISSEISESKDYKKYGIGNIQSLKNEEILRINEIDIYRNKYIDIDTIGKVSILSRKMRNIFKKSEKLLEYQDIPVLIEGRTGTGKEVIAKYIHYKSSHKDKPFIGLNCSTISKELFESELFGYEGGAFTGAFSKGKDGKIMAANEGTLFLDEITEIPLDLQSKLLRVLQEKEYYKVGGNNKFKLNSRIICSSNENIEELVSKNLFREDLYYRLNICKINLPDLKERREEIAPLLILFIKEFNKQLNKNIEGITGEALKKLINYNWPGNIRELKNIIMQVMLFCEEPVLNIKYFSNLNEKQNSNKKELDKFEFDLPDKTFDLEQHIQTIIKQALKKFDGNKTETAKYLGISRKQLYSRYKV